MYYIYYIPIIAIVILLILIFGGMREIQPGKISKGMGVFLIFAGLISLFVTLIKGEAKEKPFTIMASIFAIIIGIIAILIGNSMGDLDLFEFLFGTGWY